MGLYKELHKPRSANEHNYISIKAKRECAKLSADRSFVRGKARERTENRALGPLAIPRFTFVIVITTARVIMLFPIVRPPTGAASPRRNEHKFRRGRSCLAFFVALRSRILANAAVALFPTGEKRTLPPQRSHPLPCKCNYYRFERTRESRKNSGIFIHRCVLSAKNPIFN